MLRLANATLLTLVACFSLSAESAMLKADIPFDFQIGEVRMPAGVYFVFQDNTLVRLRGDRGGPSALYLTVATERRTTRSVGILEFNRYGGENFLTKLWAPESNKGLIVPMGKREKELVSRSAAVQLATVTAQRK